MDTFLSSRIREVRQKAGLTQAEFGRRIGVSGLTVNRFENGHREPGAEQLIKICQEFGCGAEWLLMRGSEVSPSGKGIRIPLLAEPVADISKASVAASMWITIPDAPQNSVAIFCSDDAMSPIIKNGDLVVYVSGDCRVNSPAALVDKRGNNLTFRWIRRSNSEVTYVPENKEFSDLREEDVDCVGTAIKVIRNIR